MSQLSFVQIDSDDDERRLPILPSSSSNKGSSKKTRRKSAKSISPGAAIQNISLIDEKPELKAFPAASTREDRDRTRFSSHKRPPLTKPAPRQPNAAASKHPLLSSKQKQRPNQSAGNQSSNDVPRPVDSSNPTQDMEVPYAQNLGIEGDENLLMACALSDCPKEPLNPGDVVHYFHPAFAAGSDLSVRVTQVIATDPSKVDFPLELDNGDLIPRDTRMRRLKEYDNGKLYNHPGIFRDLETFRMKKRSLSSAERKMLPNARQKTMDLLNDILNKANEKLENLPLEIMSMASPTLSSQKKRKASSEPICQIQSDNDSDSSSDSDSDSSHESPLANLAPRKTVSMASRFSVETQQNRKHLSPRVELRKEQTSRQHINNDSNSPKPLVLKNLGGLKRTVKSGPKINAKQGESGFSVRKEYTTSERASSTRENSCPDSTRTVINLTTKESKGSDIRSSKERRSLRSPLHGERNHQVHELASSDSDDDFDNDLRCPVFSGRRSKNHKGIIVSKSKAGLCVTDATSSATKPTATSNLPIKETSRWSLDSVNKKDNEDGLWDSSESDIDSTRISVAKKRQITKANQSQSTSPSQDQSVLSRRRKIKDSSFLPSELDTQDSSCTPHTEDVTSEKDIGEEYPRFLNKRTPQHESQDEDIDGFSSQETPGNKSNRWRSRPFRRAKPTGSTSTLKLKPVSYKDRF